MVRGGQFSRGKGASYTVTQVPTRKLSDRMGLRKGGGGGSSLGTLSADTCSLSARNLSSAHQYGGMIVGTGVGSRVGGPARKGSRSSSKASVSLTPGIRCDPLEEGALDIGRGHGPRQAHSQTKFGLGDEPAEGEEEERDTALAQRSLMGGGGGGRRGGMARPLRNSQGLLMAVPANSLSSLWRLFRE